MYKILYAQAPDELEKKVTEYINNGWIPLGGVSIVIGNYTDNYVYGEKNGSRATLYEFSQAVYKGV